MMRVSEKRAIAGQKGGIGSALARMKLENASRFPAALSASPPRAIAAPSSSRAAAGADHSHSHSHQNLPRDEIRARRVRRSLATACRRTRGKTRDSPSARSWRPMSPNGRRNRRTTHQRHHKYPILATEQSSMARAKTQKTAQIRQRSMTGDRATCRATPKSRRSKSTIRWRWSPATRSSRCARSATIRWRGCTPIARSTRRNIRAAGRFRTIGRRPSAARRRSIRRGNMSMAGRCASRSPSASARRCCGSTAPSANSAPTAPRWCMRSLILGMTMEQIGQRRGLPGQRWIDYFARRFRECLDRLALIYGFATARATIPRATIRAVLAGATNRRTAMRFFCIFLKPRKPLVVHTCTGALLFPGLSAAPPGDYIPLVRRCAFQRCHDADARVPWQHRLTPAAEAAMRARSGNHTSAHPFFTPDVIVAARSARHDCDDSR